MDGNTPSAMGKRRIFATISMDHFSVSLKEPVDAQCTAL
jgi:hypothetical protein